MTTSPGDEFVICRRQISEPHLLKCTKLMGIHLFLQFNTADDLFPAQCSLLFHQSAERYLGMQGLFTLGTWLAGSLVSEKEGPSFADQALTKRINPVSQQFPLT